MEKVSKYAEVTKKLWINNAFISKKIENNLGCIHGIGFTEYMVLHNLVNAPNKALRRVDLANSVGRTASGVTRMLLPMEKLGLIEKELSPRDARASLVKITTVGEGIFKDASITLNQKSEQLLDRLDSEQIDIFLKLLNVIQVD